MATLDDHALLERRHSVTMTGLGAEVAGRGELGAEVIGRTAATVAEMVRLAIEDGAEEVGLVATEFARNAPDAAQLVAGVHRASGQNLRVLTGEAEARLSYLGATAFRVPRGSRAIVADIGGGSTEVVAGHGTRPQQGTSLKLGSAQLLRAVEADDPLTPRQLAHAEARASMIMEAAPRTGGGETLIVTGGTAANLPVLLGTTPAVAESAGLGLAQEVGEPWTNVRLSEVERARKLTLAEPSSELAGRTGLSPKRARLMAGGVLILLALLERYRSDSVTVTERGLRDGVILAMAASRRSQPSPV